MTSLKKRVRRVARIWKMQSKVDTRTGRLKSISKDAEYKTGLYWPDDEEIICVKIVEVLE